MSTLLRPVVIEGPCQTSLRGRRRSSIHPFHGTPFLFKTSTSQADDVAVFDGPTAVDPPEADSLGFNTIQTLPPTNPSFPSNAHLPDLATKFTIPRHSDRNTPPVDVYTPTTPSPTIPSPGPKAFVSEPIPANARNLQKLERLRWRLVAGSLTFFLCGWGDGVTATVLPYFMTDFHLSSMTLSLLYLGSTCGFASGSFIVERLLNFLGKIDYEQSRMWPLPTSSTLLKYTVKEKSKDGTLHSAARARFSVLIIGCVLHTSFFVIMASRSGFPAMFVAYGIAAFARAMWTGISTVCVDVSLELDLTLRTGTVYFAQGPKHSMAISYGLWSLGGVCAPLAAQAVVAKGIPWPQFYYGSLVISGLNFVFLLLTYRPTENELFEERRAAAKTKKEASDDYFSGAPFAVAEDGYSPPAASTEMTPRRQHTVWLTLSLPLFWIFAIAGTLYSGSETCTVSFMVTYLLQARNADPNSAGYVTSGFWGGITIGRFLSGYLYLYPTKIHHTGESRSAVSQMFRSIRLPLPVLAFVFHLLIWLTKSVFVNAFCASIIGLLYGPIYPGLLSMATEVLPDEVHLVSMSLIATMASAGSALLPFVLGTVMKVKGTYAMNYMAVPLAVVFATIWAFLPSRVPANRPSAPYS
ncbi:MFS general substrate transporter [Amanita rubescens]|nr:MFS general substrate transporter [Amanita rubescens]